MEDSPPQPTTFKAIQLSEWATSFKISHLKQIFLYNSIPMIHPSKNQVLIKVERATINPADMAFVRHFYNPSYNPPKPFTPGIEGSGYIVGTKQRVSFFTDECRVGHGTWGQYVTVDKRNVLHIPDDITFEQAATASVNPWTAIIFLYKLKKHKAQTCILTASFSSISKMFLLLAEKFGIKCICVVRKDDQVDSLQDIYKACVVALNQNDPQFENKLSKAVQRYQCRVAFDAVAGNLQGIIFKHILPKGIVYVYGGLSGRPATGFDCRDFIFHQKQIEGIYLDYCIKDLTDEQLLSEGQFIVKNLKTLFKTSVAGTLSIKSADDLINALYSYVKNMSSGKILLNFQ